MKYDVKFMNILGEIWYEHKNLNGAEPDGIGRTVPDEIVKQGEEYVEKHVESEIDAFYERLRKQNLAARNISKNPISIQTEYDDGTLLEGRIVGATSLNIFVELDKPLKGSWSLRFGFASAMNGKHIWENDKLTRAAYGGAYRCLRIAYEKALSKPQQDLIDRLNEKFGG